MDGKQDDLQHKIICNSCGYTAGECSLLIKDFICRFCVDEADCFIDYFFNHKLRSQYETLTHEANEDWDRHRKMIEVKEKINRLYWDMHRYKDDEK